MPAWTYYMDYEKNTTGELVHRTGIVQVKKTGPAAKDKAQQVLDEYVKNFFIGKVVKYELEAPTQETPEFLEPSPNERKSWAITADGEGDSDDDEFLSHP